MRERFIIYISSSKECKGSADCHREKEPREMCDIRNIHKYVKPLLDNVVRARMPVGSTLQVDCINEKLKDEKLRMSQFIAKCKRTNQWEYYDTDNIGEKKEKTDLGKLCNPHVCHKCKIDMFAEILESSDDRNEYLVAESVALKCWHGQQDILGVCMDGGVWSYHAYVDGKTVVFRPSFDCPEEPNLGGLNIL